MRAIAYLACISLLTFLDGLFAQEPPSASGGIVPADERESTIPPVDLSVHNLPELMFFFLEDGKTLPPNLSINSRGACSVTAMYGNGQVYFRRTGTPRKRIESAPCLVVASAPGMRSWIGELRNGENIRLKQLEASEGSTVSITGLNTPAAARKAFTKGEQAFEKRNLLEARTHLAKAIQIYPNYALAWSELGKVHEELRDPKQAESAYRKSVSADAMFITPLVQLAALKVAQQDWTEAISLTEKAIQLNAIEFPGAFFYRALAHMQNSEWDQASQLFKKTIDLDYRKEYTHATVFYAMALNNLGDRTTAISALEAFLQSNPPAREAQRAQALRDKLSPQL